MGFGIHIDCGSTSPWRARSASGPEDTPQVPRRHVLRQRTTEVLNGGHRGVFKSVRSLMRVHIWGKKM